MKKIVIGIIIGLVVGILAGWFISYRTTPSRLFAEDRLPGNFEQSVKSLEAAVLEHGWKVPHVVDLQASMKKFGKDVASVTVYELCNPAYAYRILSHSDERIVSNLMPCRVAVYEKEDGSVWISRMDNAKLSKPMSKVISETLRDAQNDIEEIIAELVAE